MIPVLIACSYQPIHFFHLIWSVYWQHWWYQKPVQPSINHPLLVQKKKNESTKIWVVSSGFEFLWFSRVVRLQRRWYHIVEARKTTNKVKKSGNKLKISSHFELKLINPLELLRNKMKATNYTEKWHFHQRNASSRIACTASMSTNKKRITHTYQKSLRLCHIIITCWKKSWKKGAEPQLNDKKKRGNTIPEKKKRMSKVEEKNPQLMHQKTSDISHCNS